MIRKIKIAFFLLAAIVVVAAIVWVVRSVKQSEVTLATDDRIALTPQQITSIKSIGEWEFLSVVNEELVDTVRKGVLTDDYLARIYYGTARLGINMHQVAPGWITQGEGDTMVVTLPPVGLLERDFIDEARTKSFFERGRWSHKDREALYHKAYRQMVSHSMTADNMAAARENGEALFMKMMKSMGFSRVRIRFSEAAE